MIKYDYSYTAGAWCFMFGTAFITMPGHPTFFEHKQDGINAAFEQGITLRHDRQVECLVAIEPDAWNEKGNNLMVLYCRAQLGQCTHPNIRAALDRWRCLDCGETGSLRNDTNNATL